MTDSPRKDAQDVTSPPMTLEEQVEYWMDRYFKLQDEHAAMVNQLKAIETILAEAT